MLFIGLLLSGLFSFARSARKKTEIYNDSFVNASYLEIGPFLKNITPCYLAREGRQMHMIRSRLTL
jgi:hypothetical protein